jgi:predicted NAD/FAD-binding protein
MNALQTFDAPETYCVTLNASGTIDPSTILYRTEFAHPTYSPQSRAAQKRWSEVSGVSRTFYAGAYWGYGFHEDGVRSAYDVVRQMGLNP